MGGRNRDEIGGRNRDETSEVTQNVLAKRLFEIRQDGISSVLNAERALESLGISVETAIVDKDERRQRKREARNRRLSYRKNRPQEA